MLLDHEQAVNECLDVFHAVQRHKQRQAGPVDAAHAVGQRVEDALRDYVVVGCGRSVFALPLNAGRGVDEGL